MPITSIGMKLVKLAMPRWRKLFQFLSPGDQRRIQRSGIMKSDREMLAGLERGNENLRSMYGYYRANVDGMNEYEIMEHARNLYESGLEHQARSVAFKEKNPVLAAREAAKSQRDLSVWQEVTSNFSGKRPLKSADPKDWYNVGSDHFNKVLWIKDYTIPHDLGVHIPYGINKPKNKKWREALSERHELYETAANERAILSHIMRDKPANFDVYQQVANSRKYIKNPGKIESTKTKTKNDEFRRYGNHASIDVLVKERKDLDSFTNLKNPAYRLVRNVRNLGEQQFLNAASEFNPEHANIPGKSIKIFNDHLGKFYKNIKGPIKIELNGIEDVLHLVRKPSKKS